MSQKIYLKFIDPTINLGTLPKGPKGIFGKIVIKILTTILPKANPDYEHLIDDVYSWKLEFDIEQNLTKREIGFDRSGRAILATPTGRNYGYWTDNFMKLKDYEQFDPTTISEEEFEYEWNEFIENN